MPAEQPDVLRGTLDLLVLKTLALEPMHGWGIAQRIEQFSRGTLRINQGSLYLALQRCEPVEQVQDHCNARQICPEIASQPLDHAQPRNADRVKKQLCARTCTGLEQTILNEIFNQRRMHPGARRQALQCQLLGLATAEGEWRPRLTHSHLSFHQLARIEARGCCELFKQGALAVRQRGRID